MLDGIVCNLVPLVTRVADVLDAYLIEEEEGIRDKELGYGSLTPALIACYLVAEALSLIRFGLSMEFL